MNELISFIILLLSVHKVQSETYLFILDTVDIPYLWDDSVISNIKTEICKPSKYVEECKTLHNVSSCNDTDYYYTAKNNSLHQSYIYDLIYEIGTLNNKIHLVSDIKCMLKINHDNIYHFFHEKDNIFAAVIVNSHNITINILGRELYRSSTILPTYKMTSSEITSHEMTSREITSDGMTSHFMTSKKILTTKHIIPTKRSLAYRNQIYFGIAIILTSLI